MLRLAGVGESIEPGGEFADLEGGGVREGGGGVWRVRDGGEREAGRLIGGESEDRAA